MKHPQDNTHKKQKKKTNKKTKTSIIEQKTFLIYIFF